MGDIKLDPNKVNLFQQGAQKADPNSAKSKIMDFFSGAPTSADASDENLKALERRKQMQQQK